MPIDGRVSSLSNSSRSTPELRTILGNNGREKLRLEPTPSNEGLMCDPNQLVFKTSSLALLRAKTKHGGSEHRSRRRDSTKFDSTKADSSQTDYLTGAKRILDFMYTLWKQNRLCDVVLHTSQKNLLAHKVALGAYSDALADKFAEFPSGELISIDLSDIKAEVVKHVLVFVYTTHIAITDKDVGDFLYCSTEMGIDILTAMCIEYIHHCINPQNAFFYQSIAEQYGLEDLKEMIRDFMISNFQSMIDSHQFGEMAFDKLVHLLSGDQLGITSELDIFYAIVRWVDFNRKERLKLAATLLRCIRYQLISPETIVTKIEAVDWLFEPRDCHDWLFDTMRYHALKASGSALSTSYPSQQPRHVRTSTTRYSSAQQPPMSGPVPMSRPGDGSRPAGDPTLHYLRTDGTPHSKARQWPGQVTFPLKPTPLTPASLASPKGIINTPKTNADTFSYEAMAVAVGGIDLQSVDPDIPGRYVYRYDPRTNAWDVMTTMTEFVHHHGVVCVNGKLFIVGGSVYDQSKPENLGSATSEVVSYDPRMRAWAGYSPMNEKRAYHAVAAWNNCIYSIGGENDNKEKLDSIECLDVSAEMPAWRYMCKMAGGPRIGMAVAVYGDCLYVVGGYNKEREGSHIMDDVECYDLRQERWIKKNPLTVARCHACLVEAKGRLFLIGGRTRTTDSNPKMASVSWIEVYDPHSDSWNHVTDLAHPRHDAGCMILGPHIYVVGGVQTPHPYCLSSVECFHVDTCQMIDGVTPLPANAAGVSCCTLLI